MITRRELGIATALVLAGAWRAPVRAADPAPARRVPGADEIWAGLMAGNRRFVAGTPRPRALAPLRRELARGQYPLVTVLGCSDSRVSPSLVFDQTVGDLFEVRAAGNVADAVALGSIEYAVQDLRTPMLLVLGHDQCGAVVAAVSGEAMPSQGLQALVKRIAPAVERVRGQATGEALVALAVEANVQQSARDLLSESAILRRHVEGRQLTVVTALYRLATGDVVRLA
ncbi:MAG: carbonic anhydrase [Candidatus Rokuibacteriota bacterium]|nr:MAG: carbonic anhydrase [Candidatus Rokubacteria bacterium]